MGCNCTTPDGVRDKLELQRSRSFIEYTPDAWLVQQAVIQLNSSGKQAEQLYARIIELLIKNESGDLIIQLIRTTPNTDVTLKWSLLYILGDVKSTTSVKWMTQYTLEPLPVRGQSCEGPRDGELLLRTMAIESIKKIALQYPDTSESILRIIAARPDKALLIEAVKAAIELGLKEKLYEILPKEDLWTLDIRKARIEEFHAESGKTDTKEIGYIPPRKMADYTTPSIKCACTTGGINHG